MTSCGPVLSSGVQMRGFLAVDGGGSHSVVGLQNVLKCFQCAGFGKPKVCFAKHFSLHFKPMCIIKEI